MIIQVHLAVMDFHLPHAEIGGDRIHFLIVLQQANLQIIQVGMLRLPGVDGVHFPVGHHVHRHPGGAILNGCAQLPMKLAIVGNG